MRNIRWQSTFPYRHPYLAGAEFVLEPTVDALDGGVLGVAQIPGGHVAEVNSLIG